MVNYINKLLILLLLAVVVISCINQEQEKKTDLLNYSLIVKDSLVIKKIGSLILQDRNSKEEYLFSINQNYEIIITDRKGNILYSFNPTGEGDKECGNSFLCVGYFSENSIVVLSRRGYFFYTLDGKFIRKIEDPTPIARTGGKIKTIILNGDTCLISLFKHYFDPLKYDNMLFKKEYYEKVRLFTLYNVTKQHSSLVIGYEPNSFYRQFQHFYVSTIPPQISFNPQNNRFYVLLNPDTNIYVYDTKDSIYLAKVIPIQADYFKLSFLQPFREKKSDTEFEDALKSAALNGSLDGLATKNDTLLISYTTGIDADKAKNLSSIAELNAIMLYKKSYMQVYVKDKRISNDIPIPENLFRVAVFNNTNDIIMQTAFSTMPERPNYSVFYICKLEKI